MLNDVLMTPWHHIQIHVYFISSLYPMFSHDVAFTILVS